MIKNQDAIPLPDIVDDENLHERISSHRDAHESTMFLFVHSCKLFDILQDILQFCNAGTSVAEPHDILVETLKICKRLDSFNEHLPPALQITGETSTSESLTLQQQVLHCRYGVHICKLVA